MLSDGLLRQMVDAMPTPVFVKDGNDRYVYVNRAFELLFQVRREHIVGRVPEPASAARSVELLRPSLPVCPTSLAQTTTFESPDGGILVMGVVHGEWATPDAAATTPELEAARAELRAARQELARLRETDPVTQCLSRRALRAHTEAIFAGDRAGVVRMKLDDLDTIVDGYGHDVGDELLSLFSDIVRSTTRPDDLFARVADDEFTLVLRGADREQTTAVARRICSIVTETMLDVAGDRFTLSVSVGAAFSDANDAELSQLVARASDALRAATRNEPVVV